MTTPAPATPKPRLALLIGCNYVASPQNRLQGCVQDILAVRNMLIDAFGYDKKNMIVLRDDVGNLHPTKANILGALKAIFSRSADCDEIWIHYSGHGTQTLDTSGDEAGGKDSAIVPCDFQTAGLIIDDELFALIKTSQCRTILMFDCCCSGSIGDLPWSFQYKSPTQYERKRDHPDDVANQSIFLISGCGDAQTSADAFNAEEQHYEGAFTMSLLECIRDSHHNIELFELYHNVCGTLAANKYTQIPVLSSSAPVPQFRLVGGIGAATAQPSAPINFSMTSAMVAAAAQQAQQTKQPKQANTMPMFKMGTQNKR